MEGKGIFKHSWRGLKKEEIALSREQVRGLTLQEVRMFRAWCVPDVSCPCEEKMPSWWRKALTRVVRKLFYITFPKGEENTEIC